MPAATPTSSGSSSSGDISVLPSAGGGDVSLDTGLSLSGDISQTVDGRTAVQPFPSIIFTDTTAQIETVTVTLSSTQYLATVDGTRVGVTSIAPNGVLSGGGFMPTGTPGVYTVIANSAAEAQADLRAAVYTPTPTATGSPPTLTSFTVAITPAIGGTPETDGFTSVTATHTANSNTSPAISGVVANQADPGGATISPFASVGLADPNGVRSETVTVDYDGNGGALSGAGFSGSGGSLTGDFVSAAAAQAALRALSFAPTGGQIGTTTFIISITHGLASATNSDTSVVVTSGSNPPGFAVDYSFHYPNASTLYTSQYASPTDFTANRGTFASVYDYSGVTRFVLSSTPGVFTYTAGAPGTFAPGSYQVYTLPVADDVIFTSASIVRTATGGSAVITVDPRHIYENVSYETVATGQYDSIAYTIAPLVISVTASGSTLAYGHSPAQVDAGVGVTYNGGNLSGATVTVSNGYVAGQDVLAFTNTGAISGSYANGVLTLSGSASAAAYQAALASVTYSDTSATPTGGTRSITFSVTDSAHVASSVTDRVTVAGAPVAATPTASTTALVSTSAASVEGNAASSNTTIVGGLTANGASVLFASGATNLSPADANTTSDLFLKNTATGAVTLVTTNNAGVRPNADTFYGSVDGDGNLVAFTTTATNVDPRATDGNSHLYVRNVSAGTLTLVTPTDYTIKNATTGATESDVPPNGVGYFDDANLVGPSISGSGRYVAVQANKGGATAQVLVFDTVNHTAVDLNNLTTIASHPAVSQDGSTVVFHTTAQLGVAQSAPMDGSMQSFAAPSGLAAAAATPVREVYAYSIATNSFQLVSDLPGGNAFYNAANGDSVNPTVSNSGTRVAFQSAATNLDARDTDTVSDVYVKDLTSGQLFLADTTADGLTKANAAATNAYISGDGTMVTFTSAATNLVSGVADGRTHVYLKSLSTGAISVLDQTGAGAAGDGSAAGAAIFAPDSAHVAFTSGADNLVANDTNGASDVFLATLGGATVAPPPPSPPANTPPAIGGTQAGQADTAGVAISPFAQVTVTDPDSGQTETVTVTLSTSANGALSGGGFVQTAAGVYSVAAASAAAAQADLRAAVFTPVAGQTTTTGFTVSVSDGQAATTDSTTSVAAVYTPPSPPSGGGSGGGVASTATPASVASGFATVETSNLLRALLNAGGDAATPGTPIYAQVQAEKALAAQLDSGQITQAQAEAQLVHLVDGTTAVAVADYAFFTGYTPSARPRRPTSPCSARSPMRPRSRRSWTRSCPTASAARRPARSTSRSPAATDPAVRGPRPP